MASRLLPALLYLCAALLASGEENATAAAPAFRRGAAEPNATAVERRRLVQVPAVKTARRVSPTFHRGHDTARGVIHKSQIGDVPVRKGGARADKYYARNSRCDPGFRKKAGECVRVGGSRQSLTKSQEADELIGKLRAADVKCPAHLTVRECITYDRAMRGDAKAQAAMSAHVASGLG